MPRPVFFVLIRLNAGDFGRRLALGFPYIVQDLQALEEPFRQTPAVPFSGFRPDADFSAFPS